MHTQCPYCQTIFRVTAAHLNIAQGHVRCSHCRNIFNATNHLLKQTPKPTFPEEHFRIEYDQNSELQDYDIPELLQEDVYEARGKSWGSFFFWGIMVIFLSAVLAGQTIWFWQRDKVLQHSEIRPWLERFCYTFLCNLPITRDLNSFRMQEHVARIHPEMKEVIQFQAMFVNNATFSQPYPDLQLTFIDINGHPLVQHRFKPSEYLSDFNPKKQMRPQASVHLKLELEGMGKVIEGDKVAEGYRFEFL